MVYYRAFLLSFPRGSSSIVQKDCTYCHILWHLSCTGKRQKKRPVHVPPAFKSRIFILFSQNISVPYYSHYERPLFPSTIRQCIISTRAPCIFYYFVTITNMCTINIIAVHITTVSLCNLNCYMFRHFHVIIRDLQLSMALVLTSWWWNGSVETCSSINYTNILLWYTGYTQKNGAVSKVNKEFISHLTLAQPTPSAAATVQVSHALAAVRFSCLLRGQFPRWRRSRKRFPVCSVLRYPDLWLQRNVSFVHVLEKTQHAWCVFSKFLYWL